jgi:hypothetical protein
MSTPVESKQDILQRIQKNSVYILALGVRRLGLFGSFVRNQGNSTSDIDLLVEFEEGEKNFDHFMALSFLLEEILGLPIELVTRESLSPYIGPNILNEVEYVTLAA